MFVFTNANIGGTKREIGEFVPYTFNDLKTRVEKYKQGAGVTVGSKTQKTLPAHPNGTKSHRTRDAAANRARLRGETTTSTCPPINGRAARHPARNVTAGRAGAAPAHHDPRPAHPQPLTGRGRRGNASRRSADANKRRRGARQNDPPRQALLHAAPQQTHERPPLPHGLLPKPKDRRHAQGAHRVRARN